MPRRQPLNRGQDIILYPQTVVDSNLEALINEGAHSYLSLTRKRLAAMLNAALDRRAPEARGGEL